MAVFSFGGKTVEEKVQKLLSKNAFDTIREKYMQSEPEIMLYIATECAKIKGEGSVNTLVLMLDNPNDKVKAKAAESLVYVGTEHVVSAIEYALRKTTDEEAKASMRESIDLLRNPKKRKKLLGI
ncbi:MAG: HEAT repeat domain-containing protein [Lachnospiraceae bacterium]|nr:HEAT repeat domain-containing protein [Lachnospira sp.]MBR6697194.1 HEAT repeat domain-containing protein [Lachnospiraceae bacterium]